MPERSNQGNRVRVYLALSPDKVELIDQAAHSADLTRAAWLKMAVNAYLGRWKNPNKRRAEQARVESTDYPNGWPKDRPCYKCERMHDPAGHGETPEDVQAVLNFRREREQTSTQASPSDWTKSVSGPGE